MKNERKFSFVAKNEKVKNILQDNWDDVTRNYIAVVHGKTKEKDTKFLLSKLNNSLGDLNKVDEVSSRASDTARRSCKPH